MKICKICGKTELEVEFYANNSSVCKDCVKEKVYQNRVKRESEKARLEGRNYNPRGHMPKCPSELEGKGYKYCNECKQWLPLSKFGYHYRKNSSNRYINSVCKKCASIRVQRSASRKVTMDNSNETRKARIEIDEEYKQHIRDINTKYNHSPRGIIKGLLSRAKKRAALYNLEFNLTLEDIELPKYCPILGLELGIGKKGGSDNSYSLDRIDSSKGYIKGNVQVISRLANAMKNSANPEILEKFAKYYSK